ncbi:hypothetical protein BDK62_12418 [Halomonas alkaliantarctica]|nr:hypothetical protein BDK62_12418 [Halomonas alkaliantarctica]
MPGQSATVNARIPASMRNELEEVARKRRMETGDAVRIADLVREAIGSYLDSGAHKPPEVIERAFGAQVLDAMVRLAEEAKRLNLEDSQDFGMAIWRELDNDPRLEELRPFVNRLNEALKAST